MSSTTLIFSRFASILRLLSMKPKNFLAETLKDTWLGLTSSCSPSGPRTPRLGG